MRTHVDVTDPTLAALRAMIEVRDEARHLIDLPSAQFTLDEWRKIYNFERPHGGLILPDQSYHWFPSR